jgi:gliding motility-associated-like protein
MQAQSALVVNAGNTTTICPGTSYALGSTPTASGGQSPYTYSWSPSTNLSSTTAPNPIASPTIPTWYYLTVTDAAGNSVTDTVGVNLDPIYAYNAGNDTAICIGSSVALGSTNNSFNGGVSYQWTPATALDNVNAPRPVCSATTTITYTVVITSPNCPSKSYDVKVTVNPLPIVTVCCPTTIYQGSTAILTATGGVIYSWVGNAVSDPYRNPVTVEPIVTSLYYVFVEDANGCIAWDTVTVTVIPDSSLYFYNTFSPNGDGFNDYFYIGNILLYPQARLQVYTRTGQEVYAKTGYDNSWDGTNYGDKVPEATYYYTLDLGNGIIYHKTVTIVR